MKNLWLFFIFLLQIIAPGFIQPAKAPVPSVSKVVTPKAAAVVPAQSNIAKTVSTAKTPVVKTPLQLNVKNNGKKKAHLTGFTVTYADQATGNPMTISAKTDMDIESNHSKSIGFKVKIPNLGTPKFSPFVSDVEINGESVSTGFKAAPQTLTEQSSTLALLQVTQKNGTWIRDVKAMKKANSTISKPSVVSDQSKSKITPFKEAVVAAVIEKNKNSKSKFKKSVKKIKKSKSSQAVDHALVG